MPLTACEPLQTDVGFCKSSNPPVFFADKRRYLSSGKAQTDMGTSKNSDLREICASLTCDNMIRGCGDDGAIRIFRCGPAACGDYGEGRSAGNDCSRGAVRELSG